MDIQLKKKPWFVRHKYYVSGGIVFLSLAVYTVALLFSPEKQRVAADTLGLAEAVEADFLEYVEQEGVVQPMLSLRVNSRISGYVERIVAEEGARVRQGDTLLVLSNPELLDEMEVQENALHKQLMSYREQEIEMEQKTLLLRKQVLQNRYELQRISDSYALSQEEFRARRNWRWRGRSTSTRPVRRNWNRRACSTIRRPPSCAARSSATTGSRKSGNSSG